MIFKNSNLVKVLSIGLLIQNSNVNAFDLSDVTNAVDQVNSVAKQLNAPQPIPSIPTPVKALPVAPATTEIPNEFQGEWIPTNKDDSGLTITKDSISYIGNEESYSEIKRIELINPKNTVDVTYSICGEDGEGGTSCNPPTKNTFTLSNSGNSLSMAEGGKVTKFSRSGSASKLVAAPESVDKEVIFSCTTKKGKIISLTKFGNTIQYSYGFPNKKPELVIDTLEDKVIYSYGSGRSIAANFDKGNLYYTVGLFENGKQSDGIDILINGVNVYNNKSQKNLAEVECKQSNNQEYSAKLEAYIIKYQNNTPSQ